MGKLVATMNALGSEGWELIGLHEVVPIGGTTGKAKASEHLPFWKPQIAGQGESR
jgi:hypothetical protein